MLRLAAKCLNGSRKKVKITLPLKQNIYDFKINSLSAPKKNYEWIIFSWHLCGLHEFPVTPRLSGFFGYPSWFSVYSIKFSNCISFFWPKKRLRRRLQKCLLADRNEYQSKKSRSWNSWSKKKRKERKKNAKSHCCLGRGNVFRYSKADGLILKSARLSGTLLFLRRPKQKSVLTESFSFSKYTYRNGRARPKFYTKRVPLTVMKPRSEWRRP